MSCHGSTENEETTFGSRDGKCEGKYFNRTGRKNLVVSKKKLIFVNKKGDTIMNTIAIDSNIYKGAESYAKLHNISVTAAIEKAISLFLQKVQPKQKLLETAEFNDALSYVKTLKAKGGKPIPADENSLDALVDKKYALSKKHLAVS